MVKSAKSIGAFPPAPREILSRSVLRDGAQSDLDGASKSTRGARVLPILCASALSLSATSVPPPLPPSPPPVTNWFEVAAFDGTNYSRPSNEVSWTNGACVLTWSNAPGSNVTYVLLRGRQPGKESSTNFLGHVNTVAWPMPGPLPVPPQFHLQTSTDLLHWADLFVVTGSLTEPERFYRLAHQP